VAMMDMMMALATRVGTLENKIYGKK
jgi:hypothetical protein